MTLTFISNTHTAISTSVIFHDENVMSAARALELFIETLIVKSTEVTSAHNSRTLSASHM